MKTLTNAELSGKLKVHAATEKNLRKKFAMIEAAKRLMTFNALLAKIEETQEPESITVETYKDYLESK